MSKSQGETSYKDTAFGIIPRSKLIPLEIEGIKRSWDFVLLKRKKMNISITPTFIKKMHQVGFGWIFPKDGGKFRNIEVTVSDHKPPEHFLIPELIYNYCKDLSERLKYLPNLNQANFLEELIRFLAWAHHRFLWIHPFKDYNGRIARLLTNVILLNLDLPPIELKVETKTTREKYIEALKNADEGNFSNLEYIISDALEETSMELVKFEEK